MNKRKYVSPSLQLIQMETESAFLGASNISSNPPKWEEGHNDWFSDDSDNSASDNFWN